MCELCIEIAYVRAYFLLVCILVVTIYAPPENATACRGSNVTITCGYVSAIALTVTWIINGTSFTQQEVVYSPLYELNNPNSPWELSLTVFSINHTTTFQCIVHSTSNVTSTFGTVTVIGKYVAICMYILLLCMCVIDYTSVCTVTLHMYDKHMNYPSYTLF